MSSNIQIKRVCEFCKQPFIARTTVTRFCSHKCNSRAHKARIKNEKMEASNMETKDVILNEHTLADPAAPKDMLNVKELATVMCVSERTLFRLIKEEAFPKIKLGRRLIFNKELVIAYITDKYGIL